MAGRVHQGPHHRPLRALLLLDFLCLLEVLAPFFRQIDCIDKKKSYLIFEHSRMRFLALPCLA